LVQGFSAASWEATAQAVAVRWASAKQSLGRNGDDDLSDPSTSGYDLVADGQEERRRKPSADQPQGS
jgi:hypothetical protein